MDNIKEFINKAIDEKRLEDAKSLYEKLLNETSYSYNVYNEKFEEYAKFLRKNFEYNIVKTNLESEVKKAAKYFILNNEDIYSLYMFAGNIEKDCGDRKGAFEFYLKAKESREV